MKPHGDGKNEPPDPQQVVRLLDMELARQRAARQQAPAPYRGFRMVSLVFLFAVIFGAAVAFYYVFVAGGLDEMRSRDPSPPAAVAPSPAP